MTDQPPETQPTEKRPLLIYDGDCGFCQYWVDYWRKLTDDRVDYAPYQQVGSDYPTITTEKFQKAIYYVAPDGTISSAAEASYRVLSHAPGKSFWLTLYQRAPGFKPAADFSYAFIAKRRPFFYRICKVLWGKNYEPPRFENIAWLFLRLLGLIFLGAFISFGVQAQALIGSDGILPLQTLLNNAGANLNGLERFYRLPMVFWLTGGSDMAIQAVCWGGAALSLLLTVGLFPRLCLPVLTFLYLSLIYGGQRFMTYQWDLYLVETGFIAFLLCLSVRPGIWLLRWLAFRFMFMAGMVKILSGDISWHNFTALDYHFLTQPLPTPLAWYAHHLPHNLLAFGTAATLFIELFVPFLVFFPRRLRFVAAWSFLLLQTVIALTGNYNFFNLLTIIICLSLFDDAALRRFIPKFQRPALPQPHKIAAAFVVFVALWSVTASLVQMDMRIGGRPPAILQSINTAIAPFFIVNGYGPFAVMTKERLEIVLEGSDDGSTWKEYEFKYKPGDLAKAPFFNIPHQPRLDWQMWFAVLGTAQQNPWYYNFVQRLLEDSPSVTALLKTNPFPDKPPTFIRSRLYNYRFTTPAERKDSSDWWTRTPRGLYLPSARL